MTAEELAEVYRGYIGCLNSQAWSSLARFVHGDVHHNGRRLGVPGYRRMLEQDFEDIPDLRFNIRLLVSQPPMVASRLDFHCAPRGRFLGLDVDGRKVSFSENVFYRFEDARVIEVWSVIDKTAIEAQL